MAPLFTSPWSISTTNVVKYIAETIFCILLVAIAKDISRKIDRMYGANEILPLWHRLWKKREVRMRRLSLKTSVGIVLLFFIQNSAFLALEWAFDNRIKYDHVWHNMKAPTRPFKPKYATLGYRFREATMWCSTGPDEGVKKFFRPRLFRDSDWTKESLVVRTIDKKNFTCPGQDSEFGSVKSDEEPYQIEIHYTLGKSGLPTSKLPGKPHIKYFPNLNMTISLNGMDREVATMAFMSFEKVRAFKRGRSVYHEFLNMHLARFIWADLKTKKEQVAQRPSSVTEVSKAAYAFFVIPAMLLILCATWIQAHLQEPRTHETSNSNEDHAANGSATPGASADDQPDIRRDSGMSAISDSLTGSRRGSISQNEIDGSDAV